MISNMLINISQVTIIIKDKILGFHITVYNFLCVSDIECQNYARNHLIRNTIFSDDLNLVDGGEIFPALCDDELDHDVAGGLSDADCLLLFATSGSWNLS